MSRSLPPVLALLLLVTMTPTQAQPDTVVKMTLSYSAVPYIQNGTVSTQQSQVTVTGWTFVPDAYQENFGTDVDGDGRPDAVWCVEVATITMYNVAVASGEWKAVPEYYPLTDLGWEKLSASFTSTTGVQVEGQDDTIAVYPKTQPPIAPINTYPLTVPNPNYNYVGEIVAEGTSASSQQATLHCVAVLGYDQSTGWFLVKDCSQSAQTVYVNGSAATPLIEPWDYFLVPPSVMSLEIGNMLSTVPTGYYVWTSEFPLNPNLVDQLQLNLTQAGLNVANTYVDVYYEETAGPVSALADVETAFENANLPCPAPTVVWEPLWDFITTIPSGYSGYLPIPGPTVFVGALPDVTVQGIDISKGEATVTVTAPQVIPGKASTESVTLTSGPTVTVNGVTVTFPPGSTSATVNVPYSGTGFEVSVGFGFDETVDYAGQTVTLPGTLTLTYELNPPHVTVSNVVAKATPATGGGWNVEIDFNASGVGGDSVSSVQVTAYVNGQQVNLQVQGSNGSYVATGTVPQGQPVTFTITVTGSYGDTVTYEGTVPLPLTSLQVNAQVTSVDEASGQVTLAITISCTGTPSSGTLQIGNTTVTLSQSELSQLAQTGETTVTVNVPVPPATSTLQVEVTLTDPYGNTKTATCTVQLPSSVVKPVTLAVNASETDWTTDTVDLNVTVSGTADTSVYPPGSTLQLTILVEGPDGTELASKTLDVQVSTDGTFQASTTMTVNVSNYVSQSTEVDLEVVAEDEKDGVTAKTSVTAKVARLTVDVGSVRVVRTSPSQVVIELENVGVNAVNCQVTSAEVIVSWNGGETSIDVSPEQLSSGEVRVQASIPPGVAQVELKVEGDHGAIASYGPVQVEVPPPLSAEVSVKEVGATKDTVTLHVEVDVSPDDAECSGTLVVLSDGKELAEKSLSFSGSWSGDVTVNVPSDRGTLTVQVDLSSTVYGSWSGSVSVAYTTAGVQITGLKVSSQPGQVSVSCTFDARWCSVVREEVLIDGKVVYREDERFEPGEHTWTANVSDVSPGEHSVRVVLYDDQGNAYWSNPVSVDVPSSGGLPVLFPFPVPFRRRLKRGVGTTEGVMRGG